jgi:CO/xanthine dehydrogenase Mo-binding subunit
VFVTLLSDPSPGALSRRLLLQSLGALVVIARAGVAASATAAAAGPGGAAGDAKPPLVPSELDSWVAVGKDGRVTAYFGKPDVGQGVETAIAQIVAEELDVPCDHVDLVMADTALTCNQGGASGSTAVQRGAITLRYAAAEARSVLLQRAAGRWSVPVERLTAEAGIVSVVDDPRRQVGYGELVSGYFHHQLDWNGEYGNTLVAKGKAKPKSPERYRLVGTSVQRRDVPGKIFGQFQYIADLRRPNMLYGRVIRPSTAGARPLSADANSIAHIAGARILRQRDFIGVVANSEWDVNQAAQALKVRWSDVSAPFVPHTALYDYLRRAQPAKHQLDQNVGDVEAEFARGGKVIEAEYEWPFQAHASLAPACAVAEVTADGITVWHSSQKTHATSEGIAKMLGLPVEKVRSVNVAGPGSYGRNDAGDAAADAVIMAMLSGRPVRVQGARSDGHGWDPKASPSIHRVRGALGADGRLAAYQFMSRGFSRLEVNTAEREPQDMLAGMLLGFDGPPVYTWNSPEDIYDIPNRQLGWETVPSMLRGASPLRTSNLRFPLGPQIHFASESFMDECALAAGADPIEFRLRHFHDPRFIAAAQAVAERAGWKSGPPGARRGRSVDRMTGRGFAFAFRNETVVAMIADVEVEPATGRIWPRRFAVAHDCGLIVNPQALRLCIEANVVQSTSRALFEEVKFDGRNVTSLDWQGYPILDIQDAPESVDIVLISRPQASPSGAGEPATGPTAAAIANAVFDASGVRLRRAPLDRANVRAALASIKAS